jgi:hypothetical protein
MLRIRIIRKYTLPRYPGGIYHSKPEPRSIKIIKGSLAAALMATFLDSCNCVGVTGPPPLPPGMVTENEARAVVNRVFARNEIVLEHDKALTFHYPENDSTLLNLDGYNDSLKIGYEYIYQNDGSSFTSQIVQALDSAAHSTGGPYVKAIEAIQKHSDYNIFLDTLMQKFIDTLKAQGVF